MLLTSPKPPFTYFEFFRYSPTALSAAVGSAELKAIWWLTHLSYSSGPAVRSMKSSIQSVTTQPVASPLPMPAHQGFLPVAAILSESALSSSSVVGTLYPLSANSFGEYQTSDFMLAFCGGA